jgi:abequosyltransferase
MGVLLSICIPTYNRAQYLKYNIDILISQIKRAEPDQVEICVSDNASTDHTEELVRDYVKLYPNIPIRYNKNETRLEFSPRYEYGRWRIQHIDG